MTPNLSVPKAERQKIIEELVAAIDEGAEAPRRQPSGAELSPRDLVALRDMLSWPEIKGNPLAVGRIARTLIAMIPSCSLLTSSATGETFTCGSTSNLTFFMDGIISSPVARNKPDDGEQSLPTHSDGEQKNEK